MAFGTLRDALRVPDPLDEEEYRRAVLQDQPDVPQDAVFEPQDAPGPSIQPPPSQGPYQDGHESLDAYQEAPVRQAMAHGLQGSEPNAQRQDYSGIDLSRLNAPKPHQHQTEKATIKAALKNAMLDMIPGYSEMKARERRQEEENLQNTDKFAEAQWVRDMQTVAPMLTHQAKLTMEEKQRDRDEEQSRQRYPNASEEFHLAYRNRTPLRGSATNKPLIAEVTDRATGAKTRIPVVSSPTSGGYTKLDDGTPVKGITNLWEIKQESGPNPYEQHAAAIRAAGGSNEDVLMGLGGRKNEKEEPLDRQQAALEMKVENGTANAADMMALKAIKRTRLTVPATVFGMNQPVRDTARADRSYALTNGILEKTEQPIRDTVSRLSRLEDTINQNSPQADALIAPELLTVMAGGQGSGLRMNEAEIARIIGGRSNWEKLKASVNKWRLDPAAARSITPDQQAQIRALMGTVGERLRAKQRVLVDARKRLVDSDDPTEHRSVIADVDTKLAAIDQGEQRPAKAGKFNVGDIVTKGGKKYKIKAFNANGTAQVDEVP